MESTKCCICGKEIPMDMTCIVISSDAYLSNTCCCSHEGTQELKDYLRRKRTLDKKKSKLHE